MPLIKSGKPEAVSRNIKEMRDAGHSESQSVAAAESIKDKAMHTHPNDKLHTCDGCADKHRESAQHYSPDHGKMIER